MAQTLSDRRYPCTLSRLHCDYLTRRPSWVCVAGPLSSVRGAAVVACKSCTSQSLSYAYQKVQMVINIISFHPIYCCIYRLVRYRSRQAGAQHGSSTFDDPSAGMNAEALSTSGRRDSCSTIDDVLAIEYVQKRNASHSQPTIKLEPAICRCVLCVEWNDMVLTCVQPISLERLEHCVAIRSIHQAANSQRGSVVDRSPCITLE